MRKIIGLIHMSLDGYTSGLNDEMDWIVYNDEVAQYSHDLHALTDAAIYGRVTYEGMQSYWPTVLSQPNPDPRDLNHAHWLEGITKYVVSRTLQSADWGKTVIIHDNLAEEFNKLKAQPGKDIWFLGSPNLARSFFDLGLFDEYRINVNPVVLGKGKRLFGESERIDLNLIEARTLQDGVVALRYAPRK